MCEAHTYIDFLFEYSKMVIVIGTIIAAILGAAYVTIKIIEGK